MTLFFSIVFFGSLIAIVALFTIKMMEISRERVVVAFERRVRFDGVASRLKRRLLRSGGELAKVWPVTILVIRYFTHRAALCTARIARNIESRAHKIADLVSHKHHFERTETRSEYLKRVSERGSTRMVHTGR